MTPEPANTVIPMSDNARAFVAANKRSPVVSGYALEQDPRKPSRGGSYTLQNGKEFTLSVEECRVIGMPRWKL
jgi:hypothetical protein